MLLSCMQAAELQSEECQEHGRTLPGGPAAKAQVRWGQGVAGRVMPAFKDSMAAHACRDATTDACATMP